MFLKLKEFGGISFRPEESVSLSIVHVGPYLVDLVCIPLKPLCFSLRLRSVNFSSRKAEASQFSNDNDGELTDKTKVSSPFTLTKLAHPPAPKGSSQPNNCEMTYTKLYSSWPVAPCYGSGGWPVVFCCGCLGSIPGQCRWGLWWAKYH